MTRAPAAQRRKRRKNVGPPGRDRTGCLGDPRRGTAPAAADVQPDRRHLPARPPGIPRRALRHADRRRRARTGRPAARGRLRHRQGNGPAGPTRLPSHLHRARRRAARRNLAGLGAEVVQGRFEDWQPTPGDEVGLVFAATAWHWIDPDLRYRAAWRALRPGGHLAFWSATHVVPDDGDPFFQELQEVYDEIGEGLPSDATWPRPGEVTVHTGEIEASGLFEVTVVRHFDWEQIYDAEGYIALLETFSGHIAMADWQRERLYGEIRRRLAQRPDGTLRRHWGAVLHVARRLS